MAGYAQRTILLTFPELAEEGDRIELLIRNPKTMPPDALTRDDIEEGPDGKPLDPDARMKATYKIMAGLVLNGHVYDATATGDDQPLLPMPLSAEDVAKLPYEIIRRLGDEVGKVIPASGTALQADGTSSLS